MKPYPTLPDAERCQAACVTPAYLAGGTAERQGPRCRERGTMRESGRILCWPHHMLAQEGRCAFCDGRLEAAT